MDNDINVLSTSSPTTIHTFIRHSHFISNSLSPSPPLKSYHNTAQHNTTPLLSISPSPNMDSSPSSSSSPSLPELPPAYQTALLLIDEAHAQDPNKIKTKTKTKSKSKTATSETIDTTDAAEEKEESEVPYELHYAQNMTRWLTLHTPTASPALQLACRAQHFQRWRMPRASFPATRAGYLAWRAKQKTQAAAQVHQLLLSSSSSSSLPRDREEEEQAMPASERDRIAALVSKQGLATGDEETQALEDVACLVFLDDQLDEFESKSDLDEDKVVRILQKTWAKMSPRGRDLALGMNHSARATALLEKALEGGGK